MNTARLAAGLALSTLGMLGLGALGIPAAPDLFLFPVADTARRAGPTWALGKKIGRASCRERV